MKEESATICTVPRPPRALVYFTVFGQTLGGSDFLPLLLVAELIESLDTILE